MDRRILTIAGIGLAVLVLSNGDLLAMTANSTDELDTKLSSIRGFIFGTPMKIAAVAGCVAGGFKSYAAGSPTPFLIYSGIALGGGLIPTFLDSIYKVSGMLLP